MSSNPLDSATLPKILKELVDKTTGNQSLTNLHAAAEKLLTNQAQSEFLNYCEAIRLLALMDELNATDLQNKESEKDIIRPSHTALKKWLVKNDRSLSNFKQLREDNPDNPHIKLNNDQSATFDNEYQMAIILDLICQTKCNTVNITVTLPPCPEGDSDGKNDSKRILHLNKYVSKIYETTSKNGYPHESVTIKVEGYTPEQVTKAIESAKKEHPQEHESIASSPRIR